MLRSVPRATTTPLTYDEDDAPRRQGPQAPPLRIARAHPDPFDLEFAPPAPPALWSVLS